MIINTKYHLSDKAESVFFDKGKTIWKNDPTIKNVQDAIDDLHEYALNGSPRATKKIYGTVLITSDSDFNGNGTSKIVDTKTLKRNMDKPYANDKTYGTVLISNTTDIDKSSTKKAVPSTLMVYKRDKDKATKTKFGTTILSTDAEVLEGINDTKSVNPYQLRLAMSKLHVPYGIATEKTLGTVRLSLPNDLYSGKIHNGFAIDMKTFMGTKANTNKFGVVRFATEAEYKNNSDFVAVTPKQFKRESESIDALTKRIDEKKIERKKFYDTREKFIYDEVNRLWKDFDLGKELDQFIPVGSMHFSYNSNPSKENFIFPKGQYLDKTKHKVLYSIIGNRYGEKGNTFRLMDARGQYIRMYGRSYLIKDHKMVELHDETSLLEFQSMKTGAHKHGSFSGGNDTGSGQGTTKSKDWYGSTMGGYGKCYQYSNDGRSTGGDDNLDPNNLMGFETRPWTMPLNLYIRIL